MLVIRQRFMAYMRGWKDAAAQRTKRARYIDGQAREDLMQQYDAGFHDGQQAVAGAILKAAERTGYHVDSGGL